MNTTLGPDTDLIKRMHARITERTDPAAAPAVRRGRVLSPRRPLVWGVAAALAVTGTVVADVVFSPGQQGAEARAAQLLERAADISIRTSDPVLAPGQFLKIDDAQTTYSGPPADSPQVGHWLATNRIITYVPADGGNSWMVVRTQLPPADIVGGTEAEADAARQFASDTEADSPLHGVFTGTNGRGDYYAPTGGDFSIYPRNVDLLYTYFDLTVQGSSSHNQAIWVGVNDLLREATVPADLRAALYRVLARIPGVTVQENSVELGGRTGVAFTRVDPDSMVNQREELIVDTESGQVIGTRTVLLQPEEARNIPAGTVTYSNSIHTSVVDGLPDTSTFPNID